MDNSIRDDQRSKLLRYITNSDSNKLDRLEDMYGKLIEIDIEIGKENIIRKYGSTEIFNSLMKEKFKELEIKLEAINVYHQKRTKEDLSKRAVNSKDDRLINKESISLMSKFQILDSKKFNNN